MNWKWNVFLQIDSGGHRCGIAWEDEKSLQFAIDIINNPSINFSGIYTHAGHSYSQNDENKLQQVVNIEQQSIEDFTVSLYEKLKEEKNEEEANKILSNIFISIGSTPSLSHTGSTIDNSSKKFKVNEYHPGNYIFYDQMQAEIGSCAIENCAAYVVASVVS